MSKVPPTPSDKVYVCFLPTNITEEETKAMFKSFGLIKQFQLHKRNDGFTFAYITYESIKQAQDAILVMNRMRILDKVLKVSFAAQNCISKKRRLREIREKLKQAKAASDSIKLSDDYLKIGNLGTHKSKRQIKREKQRESQREMETLQTEDSQLKYLQKVEKALEKILEIKKQLIFNKKEKEEQKRIEQTKQNEEKKSSEEPQSEPKKESEKDSKVCIADLKVFRAWLKEREREDTKQPEEATETEWDGAIDSIDFDDLGKDKVS